MALRKVSGSIPDVSTETIPFLHSCTELTLLTSVELCLELYNASFIYFSAMRRRAFINISARAWDGLRLALSTCLSLGSFAMSIQSVGLYSILLSYRPYAAASSALLHLSVN